MKRILVLSLALCSVGAFAQTAFWNGDTTGDPTMARPLSLTTMSGTTATPYEATPFWVTVSGEYVFEGDGQAANGLTHTDTFILVYSGAFNPATPLVNLIAGDDDFTGAFTLLSGNGDAGFRSSRIALGDSSNFGGAGTGLNLTANNQYYAVMLGFANADFGTYRAAIGGGQGNVNLGVVPEPATMAALGLGVAALLRRRRKSA